MTWREDPITNKQIRLILKTCADLGIEAPYCKALTKGKASDWLNKHLGTQGVQSATNYNQVHSVPDATRAAAQVKPIKAKHDSEGYKSDGFNDRGRSRTGMCRLDYDADGFDAHGFTALGVHKSGRTIDQGGFDFLGIHSITGTLYDCDGYNKDGFDNCGFNRKGFTREGIHRSGTEYDDRGFDADGINSYGFNADGYYCWKLNFDIRPQSRNYGNKKSSNSSLKRDPRGFDFQGVNENNTLFDEHGLDRDGYDKNGYNRHGYNREGYDVDGYNHSGYNRSGYNREGKQRNLSFSGYESRYPGFDNNNSFEVG